MVTSSTKRCDALILTGIEADPVRAVPLKSLTYRDIERNVGKLVTASRDTQPDNWSRLQQEMLAVLEWLWDTIGDPVLSALRYTSRPPSGTKWPRLWWCPVGPLAYLPLHATGFHLDHTSVNPERSQHPRTMLDSRLILFDHDAKPLTVADVSALRLANGLAYLSACETATTSPQLTDESLHITGAFQFAGYQHVVGTLWPVQDQTAAGIAQEIYARITRNGTVPPDTHSSAVALHLTIRRARARHPNEPTRWAAHIHTGA